MVMELRNIPRKALQRYQNGITELGIFYFAGKFIEIELFEFWQQLKRKPSWTTKNRFALMFYSNSASKNALRWSWIKFLDTRIKEDKLLLWCIKECKPQQNSTLRTYRKNILISSRSFILLFSFLFLIYLYPILYFISIF